MSDMNTTSHHSEPSDSDIPVLTDIIETNKAETVQEAPVIATPAVTETSAHEVIANADFSSLAQMTSELSHRLTAELSLQIPVLLEAALREHLPKAIGAKLQAELLSALANALPGAAQNAAAELSSTLAFEVGGLLEQRLEEEVRRAVADEIARLSEDHQRSR